MTDEHTNQGADEAIAEAEGMAQEVPALLERLADRIGAHAGASAAFGEPVERDGVTVIPVAQSVLGSGAGGGGGTSDSPDSGIGAGAGVVTRPIGYIEITDRGAVFVPNRKPWADPLLVLTYATIVLILARTVVKLVRG
jgi:hypothetical protein